MVITKAENQIFGSFRLKTKEKKRLTNNFVAAACPGGCKGGGGTSAIGGHRW